MDIDEYIDGMPILLLDGAPAADRGEFRGGWNPLMNNWVGQVVVPKKVVRDDLGRIKAFHIKDDNKTGINDYWYWDARFVEIAVKYDQVSEEDFDSLLN